MADVHNQKTRSFNMSRIGAKNTKPEMIVRRFLHKKGFRYSLHKRTLPGKPDIVLNKYKTVVFINGCFWHGHKDCKYFILPKTNTDWWEEKITLNKLRDIKTRKILKSNGWNIIDIWECQLKPNFKEATLEYLIRELKSVDLSKNEVKKNKV